LTIFVRFSESDERSAREEIEARLEGQFVAASAGVGD
jgi:hypothetical protein